MNKFTKIFLLSILLISFCCSVASVIVINEHKHKLNDIDKKLETTEIPENPLVTLSSKTDYQGDLISEQILNTSTNIIYSYTYFYDFKDHTKTLNRIEILEMKPDGISKVLTKEWQCKNENKILQSKQ